METVFSLFVLLFYIFNPDLVGYFAKIIRNNQRLGVILTIATYKKKGGVSKLKILDRPKIQKNVRDFSIVTHNN